MNEPTEEEIADVYNSIRCAYAQCEKIYGADSRTIASVLNYWVKCEKDLKQISDETWYLGTKSDELEEKLKVVTEQRDEARRLAEKYRNLSCDSQDEADETLLPWENNQPTEL